MAQVRIVNAIGNDGENRILFVYRGYYCLKNGTAAYHTNKYLRNGVKINNIIDNDCFHIAHGCFNSKNEFKRVIDNHIDYLINAFGTLEYYFSLN
jgi:hypothetical protein